ncbi:MAG: hypothetical protein ABIP51_10280 [Bacteroidia bacterium]
MIGRILNVGLIVVFLFSCNSKNDGDAFSDLTNKGRNDSIKNERIKKLIEEELSKQKKGSRINYKEFYDRLLQIDSSNINLKIRHAYSTLYLNNDLIGIKEFKEILRKENNNGEALFGLGIAFYKINLDSSFYYCEKAIEINPIDNLKIVDLANMYDEQEMDDKAIITINKAIKNLPNNVGLLLRRASYKIGVDDFEGALKDMEIVPKSHEKDESLYINRAVCYLYLKKDKECIEQADIAIKLDPNGNSDFYFLRAKAKSHLKDKEGAYEDLKKAVELGNKEARPFYEKASEYFKTHKSS